MNINENENTHAQRTFHFISTEIKFFNIEEVFFSNKLALKSHTYIRTIFMQSVDRNHQRLQLGCSEYRTWLKLTTKQIAQPFVRLIDYLVAARMVSFVGVDLHLQAIKKDMAHTNRPPPLSSDFRPIDNMGCDNVS